jgi:hypothetical protein
MFWDQAKQSLEWKKFFKTENKIFLKKILEAFHKSLYSILY